MALSTLLKTISPTKFLEDYFYKLPFAGQGGAEEYTPLGNTSCTERLLRSPKVDLLVASNKLGIFPGSPPATLDEARSLLTQGYTLGFRHVQNYDDQIAALARDFTADFAAPVDVHLYW